jgi:hypothetical protein
MQTTMQPTRQTSTQNYAASIDVAASPTRSFEAVATQMNAWWTKTTEGQIETVGDRVKVIFPPHFGFWTFEATMIERPNQIVMRCVDARHSVAGQPETIEQEWMGTLINWHFDETASGTRVLLTHDGLTPLLACWDICQDGWNQFFKGSLKAFLDGDAPSPHSAP